MLFSSAGVLLVLGLSAGAGAGVGAALPEVKLGIVAEEGEGIEEVVEWALSVVNPGAKVKIRPVFSLFSGDADIADAGCGALEAGVAGVLGRGLKGWTPEGKVPYFSLDPEELPFSSDSTLSPVQPPTGYLPEAVETLLREAGWRNSTLVTDSPGDDAVARHLLRKTDLSVETVVLPAEASRKWIRTEIRGSRLVVTSATGDGALRLVERLLEAGLDSPKREFLLGALLPQAPLYFEGRLQGTLTALRLRPAHVSLFGRFQDDLNRPLSAEDAFIFDSIELISKALAAMYDSQLLKSIPPLNCTSDQRWLEGPTFLKVCRGIKFEGLSGRVEVGTDGRRKNLQLERVRLGPQGIPLRRIESVARLSVAVLLNKPYVMRRYSQEGEAYEGFGVDLMREISKLAGFEFDLVPVLENRYGSYNRTTGECTGAIGQLIRREVDMVLGDLVVNAEREALVDFSVPFMRYGIGALYFSERDDVDFDFFFFLSPFSAGVWSCVFASLFSYATVLLFLKRKEQPSSWWGHWWWRVVGWIWLGGLIVLVASYTAGLLAVLRTKEVLRPLAQPQPELSTVQDLVSQTRVEYATLSRGSTAAFFRDSKRADHREMWEKMRARGRVIDSLEEGAARVVAARGKFAFIGETPALELLAGCGCGLRPRLRLLKGTFPLSDAGYAIALPIDSRYTKWINKAILKLQDTGLIQHLKTKWWSEAHDNSNCEDKLQVPGLGLAELGGLFIFLFATLGLAVFFSVIESIFCLRPK